MTEASDAAPPDPAELLGAGLWTRQGPATLVAREKGWVVLVPGARTEIIEAAWVLLGEEPAPDGFLEELIAAAGLDSADDLSAILFAIIDGSSAVLGVKGSTQLAVYTAVGSQRIAGTEEGPVVVQAFQDVRRIAFGDLPPEKSLGAPRVVAGVARVRGFVHAVVDPSALDASARTALAGQVEADGRSIEDSEEARRRTDHPARAAEPPSSAERRSTTGTRAPVLAEREQGSWRAAAGRGSSTAASAAPAADPVPPNVFDSLFVGPPAPEPALDAPRSEPQRQPRPPQQDRAQRRSLVSTSLFDHPRRAPEGTGEGTAGVESGRAAAPVAPAAPAAPMQAEHPASDPHPASVSLSVPRPPSSPPHVAPSRSAALPTPAESPEDDSARSAETLIAPIDDGEGPHDAERSAPRHRSRSDSRPRSDSRSRSDRPAVDPGQASAAIGAYDDLFGETLHRRIEDAAVRRADGEEAVMPSASARPETSTTPVSASDVPSGSSAEALSGSLTPGAGTGAPADPARDPAGTASAGLGAAPVPGGPGSAPAASGAAASAGGDLIDWVPGVGRAAPEVSQTAARRAATPPSQEPRRPEQSRSEPPLPDQSRSVHPGAALPRAADRPGETSPAVGAVPSAHGHKSAGSTSATAVLLSGLVCPNGHANSPERTACGACGSVLTGTPRTVARPSLGVIELSTGERIVLDRSAILGRRPRASRVSAHDVPQLITVPSPQQDISRSHLELRLEGWHVVAFDLGTTNGTTMYRDAMEPVRLRSREGVVLHEGDVIDLGDGVQLRMRERV